VKTGVVKRLIRAVIGTAIAVGIYFGFDAIPANDNPTRYFFRFLLPYLILSFLLYGCWPIICLFMGLVLVRKEPASK